MIDVPTARRPGRPRREEAGDIEKRLMDAAMQMLIHHSGGVTMNALITASGLSRKTVYARYPNMSALLLSVLRQMLDFEMAPLIVPEGPDWRLRLRSFIGILLDEVSESHAHVLRRILMMDSSLFEEIKPRIEQLMVHRYIDPLSAFFTELAERGIISPQDTVFAAETLMQMVLKEAQRQFFNDGADKDTSPFIDNATRLMCGGLAAPSDMLEP